MIRLWLLAALAGLFLGSATPPAAPPTPRLDYGDLGCGPLTTGSCAEILGGAAADPVAPAPRTPAAAKRTAASSRVKVLVSLSQQKAWVFRGGALVATSPVSTGKRGHETPVGTFRILQKKVRHRSNRYSNAPMPYMQRLTSYGIALHGGYLPGYPASHGCIRLPHGFARKLYGLTDFSTHVTVTRARPKSAREALKLA